MESVYNKLQYKPMKGGGCFAMKPFNRRTLFMLLSILETVALGLLFMFGIRYEIYMRIHHCVVGPFSLRLGMEISFALMLLFGFFRRKIEKEFPVAVSRKKQKKHKQQLERERKGEESKLPSGEESE